MATIEIPISRMIGDHQADRCRPMINKPPPFKGPDKGKLPFRVINQPPPFEVPNIRIPPRINIKGKCLLLRGLRY